MILFLGVKLLHDFEKSLNLDDDAITNKVISNPINNFISIMVVFCEGGMSLL